MIRVLSRAGSPVTRINENVPARTGRTEQPLNLFTWFFFQASTASDRITAPPHPVETEPNVTRSRTATSARVHLASPGWNARTISTSATGTRACTEPARTSTDLTSKSKRRDGDLTVTVPHIVMHTSFLSRLRNDCGILYIIVCDGASERAKRMSKCISRRNSGTFLIWAF